MRLRHKTRYFLLGYWYSYIYICLCIYIHRGFHEYLCLCPFQYCVHVVNEKISTERLIESDVVSYISPLENTLKVPKDIYICIYIYIYIFVLISLCNARIYLMTAGFKMAFELMELNKKILYNEQILPNFISMHHGFSSCTEQLANLYLNQWWPINWHILSSPCFLYEMYIFIRFKIRK